MSRFVCTTCNREFTTKYGLQKHSNKKIPCTAEKKTNQMNRFPLKLPNHSIFE